MPSTYGSDQPMQEKPAPRFPEILKRIGSAYQDANEKLFYLEDRLHLLLNTKTPEKTDPSSGLVSPPPGDTASELEQIHTALQNIVTRIHKVNRHLDQIV